MMPELRDLSWQIERGWELCSLEPKPDMISRLRIEEIYFPRTPLDRTIEIFDGHGVRKVDIEPLKVALFVMFNPERSLPRAPRYRLRYGRFNLRRIRLVSALDHLYSTEVEEENNDNNEARER